MRGRSRHRQVRAEMALRHQEDQDRKSTRLNSSHGYISYAVFCLKKKKKHAATNLHLQGDLTSSVPNRKRFTTPTASITALRELPVQPGVISTCPRQVAQHLGVLG